MSKVLSINKYGRENFMPNSGRSKAKAVSNCQVFHTKNRNSKKGQVLKNMGSIKIGFTGIFFVLTSIIIVCGAVYLYQVNDLATKGYEIKDVENRIQELKRSNEQNKIKEVELKSMYNIEKATQDFNLVSPEEITYLEINGPVAMK